MKWTGHLCLDEVMISRGQEWTATLGGWHFLRLSQGQAYWLGESCAEDLSTGGMLVLPPTRHGLLRASQLGPAELHYFRLCPELLSGVLALTERQYLERMAVKTHLGPITLKADHPAAKLFTRICGEWREKVGLAMRAQLLQVVGHCFAWDSSRKPSHRGSVIPAGKRLRSLVSQLTDSELCQLEPQTLAMRCGCGVSHLSRLFQSMFGISLRARQTELRLIRARQMLEETRLSIQEVAQAIGCRHLRYFNALFKREFGVTPASFRRQRARASTLSGTADAEAATCPAVPLTGSSTNVRRSQC